MRIFITIDGETYKSPVTDEMSAKDACEVFYDKMGDMVSFKMELENGGILLIGKSAIQNATLIFRP